MVIALMLLGVVLLIASIWAWRKNRPVVVSEMPSLWQVIWRWRWVIGVALGVGSYFLRYPLESSGARYMVYGVPFMSYAFDSKGHDYVGPLTTFAIALNFATWALLPQLFLWLFSLRVPRQRHVGNDA